MESGVREKDEISIYYDPMIAKLVVWGENRIDAISKMSKALTEFKIVGLPNNVAFLKKACENEVFQAGDYDTSFIEKNKVFDT